MQTNGGTPAFLVQANGGAARRMSEPESSIQGFGGNLFIDPCTGCNYDPHDSGLDVRGPENCTFPGETHSACRSFCGRQIGCTDAHFGIHHPVQPGFLPGKPCDFKSLYGQLRLGTRRAVGVWHRHCPQRAV